DYERVRFVLRSLKKDAGLALKLMAEQLRDPAFPEDELGKQIQQWKVSIHEAMGDTLSQALSALSRKVYPPSHPHYQIPFEKQLQNLDEVTMDKIKKFHEDHYGPQNARLVAVGDIDAQMLEDAIRNSFEGWVKKKTSRPYTTKVPLKTQPVREVIPLPDKPNIDVVFGHALPLDRRSKFYLPLYLSNFILGGDFSARLANTVRDDQGLTYHIQSEMAGIEKDIQGHWQINVILNAETVNEGIEAVRKQLNFFVEKGIRPQELTDRKNTVIGIFKVRLSSSHGLANQILRSEELGLGFAYLDRFQELVQAVTLRQANHVVQRFLHPDQLNIVMAGSLENNFPESEKK
ncbi:MAG: insulinase family protein, partial [Candidatus Omnitrophica bacterium]|nr:insulinase family protein [Candidatus Omnitrophota bacterium]